MSENRYPVYVLKCMYHLNLVIILFVSAVMCYSLYGYVREQSSWNFLQDLNRLVMAPWKIPVTALLLYCALLLLLCMECESNIAFFFKTFVEILISIGIGFILDFSYTGILLLALADIMRYLPKSKWRPVVMAMVFTVYLLLDYDLLSAAFPVNSWETCLRYFRSDVRFLLMGIRNILNSFNMLAFIYYMILLIRIQESEKERILSLNTQINAANEELRQANVQLEAYARESERNAQTQERNRLAREIHDTLGHTLTGIITGIDACVMIMDAAPEATKEQLKVIADSARSGMADVRRSVKALRPDALEKMELGSALTQMIDEMKKVTGVDIVYQCTASLNGFNKDEEDIIYRIVQESITNAIRHGKANHIEVEISMQYNLMTICVCDNGIGCKNIEKGFGLHHMDERLKMLHGNLKCSGEDGFTVTAEIPIRWG